MPVRQWNTGTSACSHGRRIAIFWGWPYLITCACPHWRHACLSGSCWLAETIPSTKLIILSMSDSQRVLMQLIRVAILFYNWLVFCITLYLWTHLIVAFSSGLPMRSLVILCRRQLISFVGINNQILQLFESNKTESSRNQHSYWLTRYY